MGALVIGSIRIDLGMETTAFTKGTKIAQTEAQLLGKKMQGIGKSMMGVGAIMTGVSAGIIAGLSGMVVKGLEFASSLGETAQQLGVTTDDLQKYRYAASQAGIEQETMDKALAKLTVTLGKAAGGSKPLMKQFEALGISVKDSSGRVKTAGQIMPELADALGKIADPAKRAAIEVALFGKAGQQLDTLLAGGAGKLNELTSAAEKLGLVLTPDQIAKADDAADKFAALQQVLAAKISGVVADNSDAILGFVNALGDVITKLGSFFQSIGPGMTTFLVGAVGIGVALGPLVVGLGALVSGFGLLVPFLAPIAAGIAAITVALAPLLLSLLPIIAPLAAIVAAWYYWDEILPIVKRVGDAVSDWYTAKIKPTLDMVLAALRPVVEFFKKVFAGDITGALQIAGQAWAAFSRFALSAVTALYNGVKMWLQDKLGAVFDWVGKKVEAVKGFFYGLYDAVVGHSYIPDMVDGIGKHMARLQGLMVDTAQKATSKTTEAFRAMAAAVTPLLERLFPEAAASNKYKAELELIDRAEKAGAAKGGLSAEQAAAARRRLQDEDLARRQSMEDARPDPVSVTGQGIGDGLERVEDELDEYLDTLDKKLVKETEKKTLAAAESFARMGEDIIFSLDDMVQSFKSGDILGGIMSMLELIGQVADLVAGITGKGNIFQGVGKGPSTPTYGGGRALGGPVVPGKTYRVGERGPEYFTPGVRGGITPAGGGGGRAVYNISGNLLTDEFWQKIQSMDDVAAAKGAMGGASMVQETMTRRSRQRLGR